MRLKDNVALITGSAQGIGRTIALAMAREGADVIISDVSAEKAEETAGECAGLGVKSKALKFDVSDAEEVAAAISEIAGEFGKLDILVNNAGITRDGLLLRMKDEDWDAVLTINLKHHREVYPVSFAEVIEFAYGGGHGGLYLCPVSRKMFSRCSISAK